MTINLIRQNRPMMSAAEIGETRIAATAVFEVEALHFALASATGR
ncbi:hypothetical protein [Methylobacterium sp. W2]|nr:hypothetical protein [Methylobacterium sp. W2]